jgi:hypothetical protein
MWFAPLFFGKKFSDMVLLRISGDRSHMTGLNIFFNSLEGHLKDHTIYILDISEYIKL